MERTCLIPVLLLMLASCSVKEARDSCPCQVEIDLSAFAKVSRSVRVRVGATRLGRALPAVDSLQLELQAVRQGAVRRCDGAVFKRFGKNDALPV